MAQNNLLNVFNLNLNKKIFLQLRKNINQATSLVYTNGSASNVILDKGVGIVFNRVKLTLAELIKTIWRKSTRFTCSYKNKTWS